MARGVESLTGVNTYSGVTTINAGTLSVTSLANIGVASGIGTGSGGINASDAANAASLVFGGGTLQYTGAGTTVYKTTLTPSVAINRLFTLAGNGTIDSSGTFGNAALGTGAADNATLWFNNTAAVAFGTAGAKTLTLAGTSTGDNEIDLQLINNTMGGALSLTKTGIGTWVLGNASNSYTGTTTITGGALRAVDGTTLPTASNLLFNGTSTAGSAGANGVLETVGTFTRSIGTGPGQVQWGSATAIGDGGFAAAAGKLTVDIGGAGAPVNWGSGGIGGGTGTGTGGILVLNSATALSEVEFVNPINLGTGFTGSRTIQVDDNTTGTTDYATVSGQISGTAAANSAALTKTGTGILILTGNNTFTGGGSGTAGTGGVVVNNGTLVINSFGANGPLGALANPTVSGADVLDRLVIGAGGNSPNLTYMGAGGNGQPHHRNRRVGRNLHDRVRRQRPLIITALTFTQTGTKTLNLRGNSTDRNEVTAVLADNGVNKLAVAKNDGGVWTLSGANTYTGGTTVSGGVMIANNSSAFGTGLVTYGNAALQAGLDVNLVNALTVSNANMDISGLFSITFNGALSNTGGNSVVNNYLPAGKALTFNGPVNLQESTNSRTFNFTGTGTTILNGVIQNGGSATGGLSINMAVTNNGGPGSVQLNGTALNTYTGTTTFSAGLLQLGMSGSLHPFGTGTLAFGGYRLFSGCRGGSQPYGNGQDHQRGGFRQHERDHDHGLQPRGARQQRRGVRRSGDH
ncbi:MAG: autotransporter-associated beta strand repeat-containing protein [Chthoniobacter sp.]